MNKRWSFFRPIYSISRWKGPLIWSMMVILTFLTMSLINSGCLSCTKPRCCRKNLLNGITTSCQYGPVNQMPLVNIYCRFRLGIKFNIVLKSCCILANHRASVEILLFIKLSNMHMSLTIVNFRASLSVLGFVLAWK